MFPVWAFFTKLHRRFRPRDEPGQERHAACVAETTRSFVCKLYTHNGTKALIRHLRKASYYTKYYTPEAICQNAWYERSCLWRITTRHTQKSRSCSSGTLHFMGHGPGRPVKTRGRPHGHGGRRSSSNSTPHLMGSGPSRPVKTHEPSHGSDGAAHIHPKYHGPRPSPAH